MSLFTLNTYKDIEELRKIQNENIIYSFIFVEISKILEDDTNIFIDISMLVDYLAVNKGNIYPAYINLKEITEDTTVIVKESLVADAILLFPHIFDKHKPFFEYTNQEIVRSIPSIIKQDIYFYNDLEIIMNYANKNNINIITFSYALKELNKLDNLEEWYQSEQSVLIDLTSISYVIEDNKNLIYSLESLLMKVSHYDNINIMAEFSNIHIIVKYFPLYIKEDKSLNILFPDLKKLSSSKEHADEIKNKDDVKKIINLLDDTFNKFVNNFNNNLIGHEIFKDKLKSTLRNFILLNKMKEQKIISIFLFGTSGIGKTEVARLISKGLNCDNKYLAKINFGNYSSKDALNSLIGSPRGYMGSEHGELSEKIKRSKSGVLLCDEFEKATKEVFVFFLELLEEGKFTDSQAHEYDLNGYIVIFTSNIINQSDYEKIIPLELQTRFDLVCEFEAITNDEKTQFLNLLLNQAEKKIEEIFNIQISENDKLELLNFDYCNIIALRDIKRIFNAKLSVFMQTKYKQ